MNGETFSVYKIKNLVNNKIYIGKSCNPTHRWNRHLQISRNPSRKDHSLIHKAINKYGVENFTFEIIDYFQNEMEALDSEQYWIGTYKTNVCKFGERYGYNLTDGGEGSCGWKPSAKSRRKMSRARAGSNNHFYGKHHTAETKRLLSKNVLNRRRGETHPMYGKHHSDETKKKITATKKKNKSLHKILSGERNPSAKLNWVMVSQIRALISQGESYNSIVVQFNISKASISMIHNNKRWVISGEL